MTLAKDACPVENHDESNSSTFKLLYGEEEIASECIDNNIPYAPQLIFIDFLNSIRSLNENIRKRQIIFEMKQRTQSVRRIYRRKVDLFDKSAKPDAEVNRTSVRLSTRVSRKHAEEFNACAAQLNKQYGMNKRDVLERALELLIQTYPIGIRP